MRDIKYIYDYLGIGYSNDSEAIRLSKTSTSQDWCIFHDAWVTRAPAVILTMSLLWSTHWVFVDG